MDCKYLLYATIRLIIIAGFWILLKHIYPMYLEWNYKI